MQERRIVKTPLSRVGVCVLVAAAAVALDQFSKSWALRALADEPIELFWTLRLRLAFNSGAAFSIGRGFPWLFVVLGVVVLAVMAVFLVRSVPSGGAAVALGLVAGGAIGNLVDRIFRGHGGAVVDFIDLQWWPVFNLADASIFIGVGLLLLTWREPRNEPAREGL